MEHNQQIDFNDLHILPGSSTVLGEGGAACGEEALGKVLGEGVGAFGEPPPPVIHCVCWHAM
jgi:hypothetical protein